MLGAPRYEKRGRKFTEIGRDGKGCLGVETKEIIKERLFHYQGNTKENGKPQTIPIIPTPINLILK